LVGVRAVARAAQRSALGYFCGPPLQGGCPGHGCVAIRPALHLGVRELALKGPRCAQSLRGIARLCAIHGSELLRASCAQPFGFTRLFAIPGYESIAPSSRLPLVRRLAGVDVFLVGARPEIPHLRHRLPPSLLGVPVYACVARSSAPCTLGTSERALRRCPLGRVQSSVAFSTDLSKTRNFKMDSSVTLHMCPCL